MDNQHKKITGYRELCQSEIDNMNLFKTLEKQFLTGLNDIPNINRDINSGQVVESSRCAAIAKQKMQEACMWVVRSVALPN